MFFSSSPVTATRASISARPSAAKQVKVGAVTVDHKRTWQSIGDLLRTVGAIFEYLDVCIVCHVRGHKLADQSTAENHHIFDGNLGLACVCLKTAGIVRITDDKDLVTREQLVVSFGDDRAMVATDGDDAQRRISIHPAELGQRFMQQRRRSLHKEAQKLNAAIFQFDGVRRAGLVQQADDGVRRLLLGVDDVVSTQFFRRKNEISKL